MYKRKSGEVLHCNEAHGLQITRCFKLTESCHIMFCNLPSAYTIDQVHLMSLEDKVDGNDMLC